MTEPLVSGTMLFRFALPCRHHAKPWTARGADLGADYALPHLGELDDRPTLAEVRLAWNDDGLTVWMRTTGKRQRPWCRATRPEDSDGLHLFVATRRMQDVHRATRFCHYFALLPAIGSGSAGRPAAQLLSVPRAREEPKPVDASSIPIRSKLLADGYELSAQLPAAALTGFDPADHRQLALSYLMLDRERGTQSLTVSDAYPFASDPSLWATLELVD